MISRWLVAKALMQQGIYLRTASNAAQSASPTVAVTPQAGGVTQTMYVAAADQEAVTPQETTPQEADPQVVPTTPLPPLR